jgi:hypothetical protein
VREFVRYERLAWDAHWDGGMQIRRWAMNGWLARLGALGGGDCTAACRMMTPLVEFTTRSLRLKF